MRVRPRIDAIVIAVPAKDEVHRIGPSIAGLLAAADELHPNVCVTISVAADTCIDGTAELLDDLARVCPLIRVVHGRWSSVGAARRAAVTNGLRTQRSARVSSMKATWIASTDADSQVPLDWLVSQVSLAEGGYDAIAGTVEIADDADRTEALMDLFTRNYALRECEHDHVHGANMGLRAQAYLAAGGFPAVRRSEDRLLWNEVVRRRFRTVSPLGLTVSTSGRLSGRVAGGFSHALANSWE